MTKCNAVMAFIDRFLRGQLLFIINLSVYHSGLLLYPFPVSEGRKKSILEAVGHCSIVCSHAIFMITAILLNSQNSHYIENKLQSLHVCIACKHVKQIRGSINTQSDSFMLIRCVGFMFRDYCFRDMAIQGAEVSFMLLKSVQETETYEECCDTFTIGESDCICY